MTDRLRASGSIEENMRNQIRSLGISKGNNVSLGDILENYLSDANIYIDRANTLPNQGRKSLEIAEKVLLNAKKINNGALPVYDFLIENKLGEVYFYLEKLDDSLKCFDYVDKIICDNEKQSNINGISPEFKFKMYFNKACVHYDFGVRNMEIIEEQWEKACLSFDKMLSYAPNKLDNCDDFSGIAYQFLGIIELHKIDEKNNVLFSAKDYFEKSVEKDPSLIDSLIALATILIETGDIAKGKFLLNKASRLDANQTIKQGEYFRKVISEIIHEQNSRDVNKAVVLPLAPKK